ncbi:hypothetical protein [Risungbinella massiliensis]|nr:hypothetical protein [Risungbinella massiliensis]
MVKALIVLVQYLVVQDKDLKELNFLEQISPLSNQTSLRIAGTLRQRRT